MNTDRRIEISMDEQRLNLFEGEQCLRSYVISTASKGMGFELGSYRTPTGNFQIMEKIGHGEPLGTLFTNRVPCGCWKHGDDIGADGILSRILWLDGLDSENSNTAARHIYIHGTNREDLLGMPASHGCVRMANSDVIELFNLVRVADHVRILPATRKSQGLFFIDCDSTLTTIEGIDELARAKGQDIFQQVVALTNAAMNGEIPIHQVFPSRMDIIRPDRATCDDVASCYLKTIVPGARDMIAEIKASGWMPVILSGGFEPLIRPLAREIGIDYVEAVPLFFNDDGSYAGYGKEYPTTRNYGKNEIIRAWKSALLPSAVLMMGDGVSDLETQADVDAFIGFGGVVERQIVRERADHWITNMSDITSIRNILTCTHDYKV